MEQDHTGADIEIADLGRLTWAGPLTIAAAVAAVLVVRWVTVVLLEPPATFSPLGVVAPIAFTIVLVTAAIVVFVIVASIAERPFRAYRVVAGGALLLSLVPCVGVAQGSVPGAGWPAAVALGVMHIAAWAVTVRLLERFTAVRLQGTTEFGDTEMTDGERAK